MGVAFSPTNANIYMSITLRNVLQSHPNKPQLLKRYIDDIMMDTNEELKQLLRARNEFNPSQKLHLHIFTKLHRFLRFDNIQRNNLIIHPYSGHKDIPETPEPLAIFILYLKPNKTST